MMRSPPLPSNVVVFRLYVSSAAGLAVNAVIVSAPSAIMFQSNPNVPPEMADGSTHSAYTVDPIGGTTGPEFVELGGKVK